MSTNNNRLGKEVQPQWINGQKDSKISKVSGTKLQRLVSNPVSTITALSLKDRSIEKIEDFVGFSRLQRLDISENGIKRLTGMAEIHQLGMLNASKNSLDGSSSCEDLRYLTELRTLNIGSNPKLKHLESHVVKPLVKLQALVANDCGMARVSFLKYCKDLNTLVLSRNSLVRFPTTENLMFERLSKLSLGNNLIEDLPDLSVCPNLVELRLNNNLISTLTDVILIPGKLKILELSCNRFSSWENLEILRSLKHLTNLCLKGNPLPPPPHTYDNTQLREDTSADRVADEGERRYRHHILSMFQVKVGALEKPKIQLIVLDMKRVKMKWSHRASDEGQPNDTTSVSVGGRGSGGGDDGDGERGGIVDARIGIGNKQSSKKIKNSMAPAATSSGRRSSNLENEDDLKTTHQQTAPEENARKKKKSKKKKTLSDSSNPTRMTSKAYAAPSMSLLSDDSESHMPLSGSAEDLSSRYAVEARSREDVVVAAPVEESARPAGRTEPSGVLAVKIFKKKGKRSASTSTATADPEEEEEEGSAGKSTKRKEVSEGSQDGSGRGVERSKGKKARVERDDKEGAGGSDEPSSSSVLMAALSGPLHAGTVGNTVFGMGGRSQWD